MVHETILQEAMSIKNQHRDLAFMAFNFSKPYFPLGLKETINLNCTYLRVVMRKKLHSVNCPKLL